MTEYTLYLGTAILVAVSILATNLVFSDSPTNELRARAEIAQPDFRSRTID